MLSFLGRARRLRRRSSGGRSPESRFERKAQQRVTLSILSAGKRAILQRCASVSRQSPASARFRFAERVPALQTDRWKSLRSLFVTCAALALYGCGGGSGGGAGPAASGGTETASPPGTFPVTVSWQPLTTNADGTPLTDLAGFRVYEGTSPGIYTRFTEVDAKGASGSTINLPEGKFYVAVTAYDIFGNESAFSNEVSTTTGP